MGASDNRILPLIDRQTPVLDRIRDGSDSDTVASRMGKVVGELIMHDDDEFVEDQRATFERNFQDALADELDVDPEAISVEYISEFGEHMATTDLDDILADDAFETTEEDDDSDDEDDEDGGEF